MNFFIKNKQKIINLSGLKKYQELKQHYNFIEKKK